MGIQLLNSLFAFDLDYVGELAATEICLAFPLFSQFQQFLNSLQFCRFHAG